MFEEFYGGVGVVSSDPLRDGREPLDARTPAAGVCCKCNGTIKWHNTYIYNKTIVLTSAGSVDMVKNGL